MRAINKYYIENFNCNIIFITDGLNMTNDYEYCNVSIHVHFKEHFRRMYNDNLKQCPSSQGCTHIEYQLFTSQSRPWPNVHLPTAIRINFYKPIVEYQIEEISYDLQSLIGEVGGTLGLTVGLSFLSIFEWIIIDVAKSYHKL